MTIDELMQIESECEDVNELMKAREEFYGFPYPRDFSDALDIVCLNQMARQGKIPAADLPWKRKDEDRKKAMLEFREKLIEWAKKQREGNNENK